MNKSAIQQAHARFKAKVINDLLAKAKQAANKAEEKAKQDCPVDSGDLQSTIRSEVQFKGSSIDISFAAGGIEGQSGKFVDYARYVEDGDNPAGIAQPFMGPAWDQLKSSLTSSA